MEKDTTLKEIIMDHGLVKAPAGFTESVLNRIQNVPEYKKYRPLINPTVFIIAGSIIIILLIISGLGTDETSREPLFSLPDIKFQFPVISPVLLAGIAAGIISVFFLALSEIGLKRNRNSI